MDNLTKVAVASHVLRLLGHAASKGSQLGKGGKGLPAGKIGELFPGQAPLNPQFSTRELERLLPLIQGAQKKQKLFAGQVGNLFPGQKPIA